MNNRIRPILGQKSLSLKPLEKQLLDLTGFLQSPVKNSPSYIMEL